MQCLQDLEDIVSVADPESYALVIAGDLNTHLDTLAVPRGSGTPNSRGILLKVIVILSLLHLIHGYSHGQTLYTIQVVTSLL